MYNYIYYKLYKISKKSEVKRNSEKTIPQWVAMFSISMLQLINLMTLYVLLVHGYDLKVMNVSSLSKSHAIFIMCILYYLNYLFFVDKKRYLIIEKKFDKDSSRTKKIRTVLFGIFIALSFALLFLVLETFSLRND